MLPCREEWLAGRATLTNPFILRLSRATRLSPADHELLEKVSAEHAQVPKGERIVREGDHYNDVTLILEGLACQEKMLANGERQITALMVPGDFSYLHAAAVGEMDHTIRALAPCTIVQLARGAVAELLSSSSSIMHALERASVVDRAVMRQWLVSTGRRSAEKRMAHLFCELFLRLRNVWLVQDGSYGLQITQAELADMLGLSSVHVNRTLQRLRAESLVEWRNQRINIPDYHRLATFAGFDPGYLQTQPRN